MDKPKTFKEKAEYWLNDNVAGWVEKQLECLTTLLKEQDRDTRQGCNEDKKKLQKSK